MRQLLRLHLGYRSGGRLKHTSPAPPAVTPAIVQRASFSGMLPHCIQSAATPSLALVTKAPIFVASRVYQTHTANACYNQ